MLYRLSVEWVHWNSSHLIVIKDLEESSALDIQAIVDVAKEIFQSREMFKDLLNQKDKRLSTF